jgi:DinB superfamily
MPETPQQYTQRILGHSAGKDAIRIQRDTPKKLAALTRRLKKIQFMRRPGPGKWSIAEILAHLADAELVVGFRMRLILGSNGTPIQAFNQDVWATTFNYGRRDPKTSLASFRLLRENNLALLKSVPRSLWQNFGMHEERGQESVDHIVRMMAGHDLNHIQQVERIVRGKN